MRKGFFPFAIAMVLFAGLTGASGIGDDRTIDASALGDSFDARTTLAALGPSRAQGEAIVALVREHPDVRLGWNRRFGTPASIIRHGATLTGARSGSPASVAKAWLSDHAALFGWSRVAASALTVEKTLRQPGNGPVTVLLHQVFGGLHGGSLGGSVVVGLDRANRIVSVRANVVRVPALAGPVRISPSRAFEIASGVKTAPKILGRVGAWTRFARGRFGGEHYAQPVAFPVGEGAARPAWEVFFVKQLWEGYRTVIDGATGEVLYRHQLVDFEAPEGRVFDNYPGAAKGGEHVLRSFAGDPAASPEGWLTIGPGIPSFTSIGNNASTATNWGVFIAPDGPGQLRAVAPDQIFDFAFTDAWAASECGVNPISTALGAPDTPTYAQDALPAVTNLFYHHNVMHDFWYKLGFNEEAGAMQLSNFGKTGSDLEHDPLIGLVQAGALAGDYVYPLGDVEVNGAGRDNAYMFPLPDGLPQWSGMFLFEPIPDIFQPPCVDGDFDASVIYHEYAHGVTNRWVGAESGNLETLQGGSMGESWGDFYGMHYLHKNGFETSTGVGIYDTGDPVRGIRNFALDKVDANYGDIGYDVSGEEVHADGEIWNGVLWDIRTTLAAARKGGADLAAQLIADAMPISGPAPSMLNMRDAILQADVARTKGANQDLLWTVFARHGMGFSAFTVDGADLNPIPAFDHKKAAFNGRVAARLIDAATGKPLPGARVMIGVYEARVTPLARTSSDGFFTFPIAAGTYPLTIQARGYGKRTLQFSIKAGQTLGRALRLPVNYASQFAGAKIVDSTNLSDLGPPELAIDDSEASSWRTDDDGDATNESFVIDLAGDAPVTISQVQVSAFKTPGGARFEAVKGWKVFTSLDGKNFTQVTAGDFGFKILRPRVPDLRLRLRPLAKPVLARFIKFVADGPQSETTTRVQAGDVQVFGTGPAVSIAAAVAQAAETFHDEGQAVVASADASLTLTVMETLGENGQCIFPPPTQGIDAWVSELPDTFGDGAHLIDVQATPIVADPRPDVDVYFLTKACSASGSVASTAPREVGTIPQASKYVVTQLYTTALASIVVDAKADTSGTIAKAPAVGGTKTKRPAQKPRQLPATGVASSLPLGLGLLGGAAAVTWSLAGPSRRRIRRT